MSKDYEKRFYTLDKRTRITIYRDEYADNPRDMTDEPLHCEDWSRDYSIMTKSERESKSESARKLLEYLLRNYGDDKKMLGKLKANSKEETHDMYDCCLRYDFSRKEWLLMMWYKPYQKELGWWEQTSYDCKFEHIDIYDVLYEVSDETISDFAKDCFTDNIKLASYSFGYHGSISFDDELDTDVDGICWLEKDEFLKYSGCREEYWIDNDCYDIEKGMVYELEAFGNGEVYGFVVEKCIKSTIRKTYINVEKEDEVYDEEEWQDDGNSCWGFYGELDESLDWMFESAGFKKEELTEDAA